MPVPIVYRKSGEQSIATYDYFDIADGTGIKAFYMAAISGATHMLTSNQIYSDVVQTDTLSVALTFNLMHSKTFQTTFNLPRIIKGDVLLNVGLGVTSDGTGDFRTYARGVITKTSGGVDTTLGSLSGNNVLQAGVGTNAQVNLIKITVPLTKFKKEDVLKIKIDQYGLRASGGGVSTFFLGHDPKGRDPSSVFGTTSTSTSQAYIPFVLDL